MDAALKLEAQELLARAAYALDEHDPDMLGDCFAPEADFHMRIAGTDPIPPFIGHAAIMGLFRGAMEAQTDKRRHVISNMFVESGDDTACRVNSNLTLFGTENGVIRLICAGMYRDSMVRRDGRWWITERCIELDLSY